MSKSYFAICAIAYALVVTFYWFAAAVKDTTESTYEHSAFNLTVENRALLEKNSGRSRLRADVTQMVNDAFNDVQSNWSPPVAPAKSFEGKVNEREILLLGDSLLMLPSRQFKIEEQLAQVLEGSNPGFKVKVSIFTIPGARCVSMKDLFQRKADARNSAKKPFFDAVVIYWDSDIVDIDNPDDPEVKREYIRNLLMLLKTIQSQTSHVAIAGPTFSKNRGEMPEQWQQDVTYDTYVMIHQEVSRLLQVVHINTRHKFQEFILQQKKRGIIPKELPKVKDWDEFESIEGGIITFDGQHTHEQGSKLLVNSFAEYLLHQRDLWNAGP